MSTNLNRWGTMMVTLLLLLTPGTDLSAVDADLERLIRKDGTSVVGVIVGFDHGSYRVRVGEGIFEVPAQEIRTIEPVVATHPLHESIESAPNRAWVDRVVEKLASRSRERVSPESRQSFADAMAALVRGDGEIARQDASRSAFANPNWVDPLIVQLVAAVELGRESEALRLALRINAEYPDDLLADEVSAEVYRRGGFPHRAAELSEKVLLHRGDLDARRELVRTWWPIDRARAQEHWRQFTATDPRFEKSRCPEALLIRRTMDALALGDLGSAGQAIEEVARDFPWARDQVDRLRIELTRARLRQAELSGDLSLATLAADSLRRLGVEEDPDLDGRIASLREERFARALQQSDARDLQKWFQNHAHLLEGSARSDRSVASRMQELGLDALIAGNVSDGHSGLTLAQQTDPHAESPRANSQVMTLVKQALAAFGRRQEDVGISILSTLHRFLPQRDAIATARLAEYFSQPRRDFLTDHERRVLSRRLAELYDDESLAIPPSALPPSAERRSSQRRTADDMTRAPRPAKTVIDATEQVTRWFPITVGTRWTYRLDDGTTEQREITGSQTDRKNGLIIVMEVTPSGGIPYESRAWIRDGELRLGFPEAPPGEVLMQGGLVVGSRWQWRRGNFSYRREVEEARYPVETLAGVFHEVRVIRAENLLESSESGRSWSASHRITFAEGVGIVRIDGANESIDRELVEFTPGSSVANGPN